MQYLMDLMLDLIISYALTIDVVCNKLTICYAGPGYFIMH